MLKKLLKYEMKATARLLFPLYLVLAVFTIIDRIVLSLDIFNGVFNIIPTLITLAFGLSVAAIIIVSAVIIIVRFYKNLVTDEGYLMFTLPVKSHQLINAKFIIAYLWTLASIIASAIAIFIVASYQFSYQEFTNGFQIVFQEFERAYGSATTLLIIEFILMSIMGIANGILMVYVSIAIGQLFNGRKLLGSIASYIALYTGMQIISTVIMVAGGLLFKDYFSNINSIPHLAMPVAILISFGLNVAFYITTKLIFNKKLNLE